MRTQEILSTAKKHPITRDVASPDFFEGALLGNGGLGVTVCTRPDAIVLYFGHNSIWDIRIEEGHKDKIGTFREIWDKICAAPGDVHDEAWYQKYVEEVTASYHDYLYPRPYPASCLYLFFDRKEYEMLGHSLDISNGLLTITLENSLGEKRFAEIFVSQDADRVFCRTTDAYGEEVPLFYRMRLIPHKPDAGLPDYTVLENGFSQLLPYNSYEGTVRPGVDKGFSVLYKINGKAANSGLDSRISGTTQVTVQITEGCFDQVSQVKEVSGESFEEELSAASQNWAEYWERSGVMLADEFLEHIWYTNTYFIKCILSKNARCPGLFANWMYRDIGTAWHGDYHLNYNTQQVFWGLMGANRMEQHLPYLRLTEELIPVSKAWAKDFYELDGACFPHSAYPVPMTVMPYPSPDWGWEIFETPWTVQSLWWHYTYTQDKKLLRERIYPVIREAAVFLVGYMTRDGANPKGDDKYHLFPTIVPELYGLSKGFDKNLDGIADLTLTKFLFQAILQAVSDLGIEDQEAELTGSIRKILAAYPDYPTAQSRWGEVFLSVASEDPDNTVYNVPTNLMAIFPGEDIDPQTASVHEMEVARRSWRHHYNEGGNDLVFYNLVGARLGMLDLEKFKRHIRYCLLPNETATDNATLSGGRYADTTDLKFMSRMGIWIENFSLYAVIDECLLKGHTDTIELFPNWDMQKAASFCSMRTKGAFLVDANCAGGTVGKVKIQSEAGGTLRLKNPWKKAVDENGNLYEDEVLLVPMKAGDTLILREKI